MTDSYLVILGAQIANADGVSVGDVVCNCTTGKIIACGPDASRQVPSDARAAQRVREINAAGKILVPGGIDPHTHFHLPFMGTTSADHFEQGGRSALAGGTTTIIDFVIPTAGESLLVAFDKWQSWAKDATCDYAFHVAVTWWSDQVSEEMGILARERGVSSFKHFMAYKGSLMLHDQYLLASFLRCKELGCIPTVHAENGELVLQGQKRMLEQGITGPEGHPWSRPPEVEGEAANRVATIASVLNTPLYLVHCSCSQAVDVLRRARETGQRVYGEVLAAHLTIDDSVYFKGSWADAAAYVMSPPFRPIEHQKVLWGALSAGLIQTTATDHCTFCADQKAMGRGDFTKIPNGTGGVEDRLSILFSHGVLTGRISLTEFVAATSTNAAKIFGMYPRKGLISVGSDADLVLIDPHARRTISAKSHFSACDANVFEGWTIQGVTVLTVSRGQVVWEAAITDGVADWRAGKHTSPRGRGLYIPRRAFGPAYDHQSHRDAMISKTQRPIQRKD